jgi:DNA-binding transcriptional LysR family regulator
MYALPDQSTLDSKGGDNSGADSSAAFDSVPLGHDLLIPVCAPSLQAASHTDSFPIIAYPADVFLGHVFASSIAPRIAQGVVVLPIAETALTLAMVQLAISEIGIAWLPMSLVAKSLASGDLVRANAALPTQALTIKMVRLHARQTDERQKIWNHLAQSLRVGPDL